MRLRVMGWVAVLTATVLTAACGATTATYGGAPGEDDGAGEGTGAGTGSGGGAGGGAGPSLGCVAAAAELCDGLDNDCDGVVDEDFDADGDGWSSCSVPPDCDDAHASAYPGAAEVSGNGVDDDCDGLVDVPANCESELTGAAGDEAKDFFRAIGLCGPYLKSARFVRGAPQSRAIRSKFGVHFTPRSGAKLIQLSSGRAVDTLEVPAYTPQPGTEFSGTTSPHPLWSSSVCFPQAPVTEVFDAVELEATIEVPASAKGLSYEMNYLSAEYPDYVCTEFNDRFIALLQSGALDPAKLPGGQARNCLANQATPTCNVSFDAKGQPLSINNGFFSICQTAEGIPYSCTQPTSLLEGTGYEKRVGLLSSELAGGATGWLTTQAPAKPGETLVLRFIVFDEGDAELDSSVLIDNFKWETDAVAVPTTKPVLN